MDTFISFDLFIFILGTFAAAFVTGLAGFAFGLVAAAIWLYALTPIQTTALIVSYGFLVLSYAVWKLRHNLNWSAPFGVDRYEAAQLAICRACSCSNLIGLLYPSAEWRRLAL